MAPRPRRFEESDRDGLEVVAGVEVREDDRRSLSVQRQAIIDANADLQERELIKLASWAGALGDALRRRGVEDPTARPERSENIG